MKKKIIAVLLILIFLFQFIPSTLNSVGDLCGHDQKRSSTEISYGIINENILAADRPSLRAQIQVVPVRGYLCAYIPDPDTIIFKTANRLYMEPLDQRKIIRRCISQYFHESKYKGKTFII